MIKTKFRREREAKRKKKKPYYPKKNATKNKMKITVDGAEFDLRLGIVEDKKRG